MTSMPFSPDATPPTQHLDDAPTPVGSAGLNQDSVSIGGVEVGEAHDDTNEAADLTARLLQEASQAAKARSEHTEQQP